MQDIRTFVYFDLEATGLKSSGRPRVCEISLIAVDTSDILELHESLLNITSDRKMKIPVFKLKLFPQEF